jgi:LPXTG-motif cell wall-anchored protein
MAEQTGIDGTAVLGAGLAAACAAAGTVLWRRRRSAAGR